MQELQKRSRFSVNSIAQKKYTGLIYKIVWQKKARF